MYYLICHTNCFFNIVGSASGMEYALQILFLHAFPNITLKLCNIWKHSRETKREEGKDKQIMLEINIVRNAHTIPYTTIADNKA